MPSVILPRPSDWHVHLRSGTMLSDVMPFADTFAQILVMPNLVPPLTTADMVLAYEDEVGAASNFFKPAINGHHANRALFTKFLTQRTSAGDIRYAVKSGVKAAKWYPNAGTTNASSGMNSPRDLRAGVLDAMEEFGMVLCIHGEFTKEFQPDPLRREYDFIKHLEWLADYHPRLKIVIEHVSDRRMAEYVLTLPPSVAMTVTAHHPFLTHADATTDPHCNCMPIAKSEEDRRYLAHLVLQAASEPKVIFGSDSAPHLVADKLAGKAGVWSHPTAIVVLWQHFVEYPFPSQEAREAAFNAFMAFNGADFYGERLTPQERGEIEIVEEDWQVPDEHAGIVPFMAGEVLPFRVDTMRWFGEPAGGAEYQDSCVLS